MRTREEIDAYPVPALLVPRVAKEAGVTEEVAEGAVREAKRMLALAVLVPTTVAPSDLVDEAWHTMILFTRFYKEYAIFLGGFVHHEPLGGAFNPNGKTYQGTKEAYKTFFNEAPDPVFWP